jgi:predicted phage-related endonuclease
VTESPSLAVAFAYNNAVFVGAHWQGEPMTTHYIVFDDHTRQALVRTIKESPVSTVNLDAHRSAVELLRWVKAHKSEIAEVERKARAEIEAALGDNEAGTVDGELAITWQSSKRRVLDQEALRNAHPDIAEEFKKTTEVRTFKVHD